MVVSGATEASKTQQMIPLDSKYQVTQKNGEMIIEFSSGEKVELSEQDVNRYTQVLYNINYTNRRISDIETELKTEGLSEDKKVELEEELSALKEKQKQQQSIALISISADGKKIEFKIKKDTTVDEFKKAYGIKDGAFRQELAISAAREYYAEQDPESFLEGPPEISLDDDRYAVLRSIYKQNYDYRDGETMTFPNGVRVTGKPDSDGKIAIEYPNFQMQQGESYQIPSSCLENPEPTKGFWETITSFFK